MKKHDILNGQTKNVKEKKMFLNSKCGKKDFEMK